jgi:hypothetical protein
MFSPFDAHDVLLSCVSGHYFVRVDTTISGRFTYFLEIVLFLAN